MVITDEFKAGYIAAGDMDRMAVRHTIQRLYIYRCINHDVFIEFSGFFDEVRLQEAGETTIINLHVGSSIWHNNYKGANNGNN